MSNAHMIVSARYVHKISPRDTDRSGIFDLDVDALKSADARSARKMLGSALRSFGVISAGTSLREVRITGDGDEVKIVAFPRSGIWHSLIITKHVDSA